MMKKMMIMVGAVALGVLGAGSAWAEAVEFRDYDAATGTFVDAVRECTLVTVETRTLEGGWYAVKGTVTIPDGITVNGSAHLILCDGATWAITNKADVAAVSVGGGASFTIYGQTENTGRLEAKCGKSAAGIGGDSNGACGAITIHGGTVKAAGGTYSAGIGSGMLGSGGVVTITGGCIEATGHNGAADIGSGYGTSSSCSVSISGGVFAQELKSEWLAEGYAAVANPDAATKDAYPWAVMPRQCTVTIGELTHMTAAWTSGDGAVTNAIAGTSFKVKWGMVKGKVKIILTADEGYVLEGNAIVDVEFGDENEVNIADAVPKATRWNAVVTVTSVKQRWPWNGKVDVDYALSNTDAGEYYRLITAVTVGDATKTVTNELGQVSNGAYTKTVDCGALFGEGVLAPASVTMSVLAYSAPVVTQKWMLTGPFMIIDLGGENGNGGFTSTTYETADKLPEGAWNLATGWADEYKTRYLVMRKVKAGKAYPCEPNASIFPISGTMTPTNDYWIGVHQVTQEQYARVMGEDLPMSDQAKPKSNISWHTIRGGAGVTEKITGKSTECFMQKLCMKTGLGGFDLPTEAQWEIAARAGSAEEYGEYVDQDGKFQVATTDNLANIAWYNDNVTSPQVVGLKRPNLWGLYDTAGNVHEWCRDVYSWIDLFDRQDVETPATGDSSQRVCRGGYYHFDNIYIRPSYRGSNDPRFGRDGIGFRLSRSYEPDDKVMSAVAALTAVADAGEPATIELPFAPDDALAYSHDGCEPIAIDLLYAEGTVTLELERNGCYAFYSNGVVTATRDVSGLGTTVTEPNWAANFVTFTLDTKAEHTFDLSAGLASTNLTYSGTGWDEAGAGISAVIIYEVGGVEAMLASGLTGTGEKIWTPPANGTFTLKHTSGKATETATIIVENLPMVTIVVGDFAAKHLTAKVVWNDTETPVTGEAFELPKGGTGAKIVLTAAEGYVLPSEQVLEFDLDDLSNEGGTIADKIDKIPAAVVHGVQLLGITNRYPWNGKIDVVAFVAGLEATNYYQLVTALTLGGTTKRIRRELDAGIDATYTNTIDCAELFGMNAVGQVSVKLSLEEYAKTRGIEYFWRSVDLTEGEYLIIDLTKTGEDSYVQTTLGDYLASHPDAWNLKTGWADEYKTRYLVMRKVKAGKAYPCCRGSTGDLGAEDVMTPQKDYWIGVHQITQAQYARVMGENLPAENPAMPKIYISWDTIRGQGKGILETPEGFMAALSSKTGLAGFDLPTEAQWEIAARAGSVGMYGSYVNEKGYVVKGTTDNIGAFAIYFGNRAEFGGKERVYIAKIDAPGIVGQLRPNLWGLYDTAGNVLEMCRDAGYAVGSAKDVETPKVPIDDDDPHYSDLRVARGGHYFENAVYCRPSDVFYIYSDISIYNYVGFRLLMVCEPEAK